MLTRPGSLPSSTGEASRRSIVSPMGGPGGAGTVRGSTGRQASMAPAGRAPGSAEICTRSFRHRSSVGWPPTAVVLTGAPAFAAGDAAGPAGAGPAGAGAGGAAPAPGAPGAGEAAGAAGTAGTTGTMAGGGAAVGAAA